MLLRAMPCKSCGKAHDFYTADQVVMDRRYEFVCPESGQKLTIVPWVAPEAVTSVPPGTVLLSLPEE
jgi:hypothetical protein